MSVGRSMSEVAEATGVTAGGLLREARQASGMHIAALAVALKVPVSKLEALEADNYGALPDTVFVRALASSMCRTLKLDPAPILALLPQSQSPRLATDSAGLNAPVKGGGGRTSTTASFSSSSTSKSVTVIVLALLVGALVLVFFPRQQHSVTGSAASSSDGRGPVIEPNDAPATPSAVIPGTSQETPLVSAPASSAAQSSAVPASTGSSVIAGQSEPPASTPGGVSGVVSPQGGVLVLRARSESWIQVRDSAGASVLQRNLTAGESVSVTGQLPLSVVVGRADATEVLVRGKPLDLTTVSRDNVARFEVK